MKRSREEEEAENKNSINSSNNFKIEEREGKRKKRSRWVETDESENAIVKGLPTRIPQGLTKEQEELFLLQINIEELTRRIRTGELGIPKDPSKRSPSPEPIYGVDGKRMNTREYRVKKKLEEDRHELILRVQKANPDYKPPFDYKPLNIKINDKVFIPQDNHPEINFVGLLLGPRGNTLKQLTNETGATIVIRGKGSIRDGKAICKDGKPLPGQDEPLHAYVTSPDPENVKKACDRIRKIINDGIQYPDADNELRKTQLMQLALLNGTLRDQDSLSRLAQYTESQSIVTNKILCTLCGGFGHIAKDCKVKHAGGSTVSNDASEHQITEKFKNDLEYEKLMSELGFSAPPNITAKSSETVSTPHDCEPKNNDVSQNLDDEYLSLMKELEKQTPVSDALKMDPKQSTMSTHNNNPAVKPGWQTSPNSNTNARFPTAAATSSSFFPGSYQVPSSYGYNPYYSSNYYGQQTGYNMPAYNPSSNYVPTSMNSGFNGSWNYNCFPPAHPQNMNAKFYGLFPSGENQSNWLPMLNKCVPPPPPPPPPPES